MTNLSPRQMVEVIVRSLDHTAMRFDAAAKKKSKTNGLKRPKRKRRSISARAGRKVLRKR
ncbi:MAG TPA: hypothetical protein VN823_21605 [Stellaceae bacterium]|nr:hypothetical protein [Stellaceae bacterium]